MVKKLPITFFLSVLLFSACGKKKSAVTGNLPGKPFINSIISRDTSDILNYIDSTSLNFMDIFYKVPFISNIKDLHYRLVISREGSLFGNTVYRYTVLFPWKEEFSFNISRSRGKYRFLLLEILARDFKHFETSNKDFYYFYPGYESGVSMHNNFSLLSKFLFTTCSACDSCCARPLVYIYTGDEKPGFIYSFSNVTAPIYRKGLCVTRKPADTIHLLHSLFDDENYLYPFVRGVYRYFWGKHKSFGIDFGDWLRGNFSSTSFQLIASELVNDMVFYKPLSEPLGYAYTGYLMSNLHFSKNEVIKKSFSLSPFERRIISNGGSKEVLLQKHVEEMTGKSFQSIASDVAGYIMNKYRDISKIRDTIVISRDRKRNITFVRSSIYKNSSMVEDSFKEWLDSLPFFYRAYYTVLLVPIWEADSFKRFVTPANSYWVPAYEFRDFQSILNELKNEYSTFLISDFIRKYSLTEKQLPLWFSLGAPMYLECRDTCDVFEDKVLELSRGIAYSFYQQPIGKVLPSQGIVLSYMLVRTIDNLHPGAVFELLEKSVSNMSFSDTYKEVTGKELREVFNAWKTFIEDTLYYRVSRK